MSRLNFELIEGRKKPVLKGEIAKYRQPNRWNQNNPTPRIECNSQIKELVVPRSFNPNIEILEIIKGCPECSARFKSKLKIEKVGK